MSDDNPEPPWIVCTCNSCFGHLEFDPANAGETVQCPHCKLDTILFVPSAPVGTAAVAAVIDPGQVAVATPPQAEDAPPKPEPKKAVMVEQPTYQAAGMEGRVTLTQTGNFAHSVRVAEGLENAGDFFLFLGVLGAFCCGFGALASLDSTSGNTGTFVLVGIAALFQGFVMRLLFKAGAEIIRLLVHSNQSEFTGKITQFSVHPGYKCSLCYVAAEPTQTRCFSCGAEFYRKP